MKEPIPGYTLQARLGAGGYGEVWSANAPGGLLKAIKFVYGYLDEDRAAREMKALNRIKEVRHPFLLSLERIEIIDGQLAIVTELAEGSLKDRYDECQQAGLPGIPREELLVCLRDAADALDFMRERFSLQHLDVKPENLLLVGGRVKVADFGLVKELHDVTASLMGGLTPLYAPPEVFDGCPSLHSDQYSLAIVFQEMLTGVMPFPGATAAQLASQHLNSKPRLSSLPVLDQPIIARALAKQHEKRFRSCRELIDQLSNPQPVVVKSDAAGAKSRALGTATDADTDVVLSRSTGTITAYGSPPSPSAATELHERSPWEPSTTDLPKPGAQHRLIPRLEPAPQVRDLPALPVMRQPVELRPTVLIGIGGTAMEVLTRLGGRLNDRFGSPTKRPSLRMLLLDVDTRALFGATGRDERTALAAAEVVPLPLRRPQDYRHTSNTILKSLSRRWLYNIPKSLLTEGLRPLGRLAFLDHAALVIERLRGTFAAAFTQDSAAPRVVLVSSISGGAGSGMVLDLAYCVRQILAEMKFDEADVDGVLMHSTGRNPTANELAIANAYACLSELQQFNGAKGYPGEASCGLPPAGEQPTFDAAYLVHLGEELSDHQFTEATESVAKYLYLDTVTPCGALLRKARERKSSVKAAVNGQLRLRTFGVVSLDDSHEMIALSAAESLCERMVQSWRGDQQQAPAGRSAERLPVATIANDESAVTGVGKFAAERLEQLGLDFDSAAKHVLHMIEQTLGAKTDPRFDQLVADVKPGDEPQSWRDRMLPAIDELLGLVSENPQATDAPSAIWKPALQRALALHAADRSRELIDTVFQFLDDPRLRLAYASRVCNWLGKNFQAALDRSRELRERLTGELAGMVRRVNQIASPEPAPAKGRPSAARQQQQQPPTFDFKNLIRQYFRLRIHIEALAGVSSLFNRVRGQVSLANEQLGEIGREIDFLATGFKTEYADAAYGGSSDPAATSAADRVQRRLPDLARQLDETFRLAFFEPLGGLRALVTESHRLRETMPKALRAAARKLLLNDQQESDISSPWLSAGNSVEAANRINPRIAAATPRLVNCGGAKNLIVVLPDAADVAAAESSLRGQLQQSVSVASHAGSDAMICLEFGDISLPHAAAMLIDNREDYAEVASRLHTRNDVDWSPWDE